jgi:hypothetical protein
MADYTEIIGRLPVINYRLIGSSLTDSWQMPWILFENEHYFEASVNTVPCTS